MNIFAGHALQVAGVVAMLLGYRPGTSPSTIKQYLLGAAVSKTIQGSSPRCAVACKQCRHSTHACCYSSATVARLLSSLLPDCCLCLADRPCGGVKGHNRERQFNDDLSQLSILPQSTLLASVCIQTE